MMEPKILCGMCWPDKGYTGYYCVVKEKSDSSEKSFDVQDPTLEIVTESVVEDYSFIKDFKKQKCGNIYTLLDLKYNSYILDFNRYKRDENIDVRLKQTNASSFEASILTVKGFVKNKKITFPDNSLIKSQLTIFSRETLLDPIAAYAVRSLCMVIGQFKKQAKSVPSSEINQKSWW